MDLKHDVCVGFFEEEDLSQMLFHHKNKQLLFSVSGFIISISSIKGSSLLVLLSVS